MTFQQTQCLAIDRLMSGLRKPLGIVGFASTVLWKDEQPAGGAEPQVKESSSLSLQQSDPLLLQSTRKLQDSSRRVDVRGDRERVLPLAAGGSPTLIVEPELRGWQMGETAESI